MCMFWLYFSVDALEVGNESDVKVHVFSSSSEVIFLNSNSNFGINLNALSDYDMKFFILCGTRFRAYCLQ